METPNMEGTELMQQPGHEIFLTNYRLGKTLGIGSFGKVKLAEHIITGHKVAIKILNRKKIKQMDMEEKVRREIQILRLFMHPHIIRLYEVLETPNDIYVVMEYVKSGELFDYIVEKGRLMEDEARHFFQQIISGVEYCHRNMVVHRDLKPENILLDSKMNVKIADFGLSNVMRDGHFLKTSCGSPNYAAPEVISGKLYAGPEVDVWSCGVILYALLCGSLPFDDENIPNLFKKIKGGIYNLPSHLSPGARDLIPRMLLVDPLKRITIPEIRQHPWFTLHLPRYLAVIQTDTMMSGGAVDEEVVGEVCRMGFDRPSLLDSIRRREQNKATVTYYLLTDNKRKFNSSSYLTAELQEQTAHPSGMMGAVAAGGLGMGMGGGVGGPGLSIVPSPARALSPVPQQRVVAERRWQLGVKAKGHPAVIMNEVLRALQALEVPWKRIGPYNVKCRFVAFSDRDPNRVTNDDVMMMEEEVEEMEVEEEDDMAMDTAQDAALPPAKLMGREGGGRGGGGDVSVLKWELMLYKLRTDEYLLDLQSVQGDSYTFMDLAAMFLQELRL